MAVAVRFQTRTGWATGSTRRSKQSLYMLYGVSALVMVRSVFRLIEYAGGQDGYLLSTEWPLYVFDSVPMWLVMVVFYLYFPDGLQPFTSDGVADEDATVLARYYVAKHELHTQP